jgi:hypothetical protein
MGCYDGSQYHWKGAGRELWHSGMISWGKIWAVRVDLSFLVAGLLPVTPPVPTWDCPGYESLTASEGT